MNMYQLFSALPRDLQWEILALFIGSHSVRKGKLICKLGRDARTVVIEDIPQVTRCYIHLYNIDFNAKTFVCLRDGSQLMYCEDPKTGETGYMYRKRITRHASWEPRCYGRQYTSMARQATALPPYVKHMYPSYPDTEKKKKARRLLD